jgi:hypothetical protein
MMASSASFGIAKSRTAWASPAAIGSAGAPPGS